MFCCGDFILPEVWEHVYIFALTFLRNLLYLIGMPYNFGNLNDAIRRIIRDCNDEELLKNENATVLLPHFSCHSLRHTFTNRMCEAGVNVKIIQETLGHKDISTTLNIYADMAKEVKKEAFLGLDNYFSGKDVKQA